MRLVGERFWDEHCVIPATAKNPIFPGMTGGIFAEAFLNVVRVFRAFEIYPAEAKGAVEKMDVTIYKAGEHKLSAGINQFCALAARALNFGVATDSDDLAPSNGHGLSPGLLGVFRVNPAVNDDDIRRFDDLLLRVRHRSSAKQEQQRLNNDAERLNFHRHPVLEIRMSAACLSTTATSPRDRDSSSDAEWNSRNKGCRPALTGNVPWRQARFRNFREGRIEIPRLRENRTLRCRHQV